MLNRLFLPVAALSLTGCMAMMHGTADNLNQIQIGMSRAEVIKTLGPPKSTSADTGIEYLQYQWVPATLGFPNLPESYFVAIRDGRVASYGKRGDMDSTATPVQRISIDQRVSSDSRNAGGSAQKDLYTELKKLQDLRESKIITDAEFETQKKRILENAR